MAVTWNAGAATAPGSRRCTSTDAHRCDGTNYVTFCWQAMGGDAGAEVGEEVSPRSYVPKGGLHHHRAQARPFQDLLHVQHL